VERAFSYPGDGINGLLSAWERAGDKPTFIQSRHEEMAAFEACGYAKFSGRVGVCTATSGPGAIHLLNGLYDAKLDHAPITPHATWDQMPSTASAVLHGDIDRVGMITEGVKAKVQEMLPGGGR
jgi:thiamine pyrophosphate-dependent acetolactate synthase large subunit-like protein